MRHDTLWIAVALAACGAEPRSTPAPRVPAPAPAPAPAAPAPAPSASLPSQPGWWRGAVFYEVFVRSFADSNGDGTGDLRGLIDHLDYLNDGDPRTDTDLGVDALWLMPVFASPSYHGYDVTDFDRINPAYGTAADFDRLLAEAHRRGMRVIVDLVLNHTSTQHPWFVESAASPSSPKRDWYVWRSDDPGWGQPWNAAQSTWARRGGDWYYAIFWGGMPDLNYRTTAVREEAKRIARAWLARGVDGFRLDAIRYLIETGKGKGQADTPETHAYLKDFARAAREVKPDALLVGEVWSTTDDIAGYFGTRGDELDALFDFPLAEALVAGVKTGSSKDIAAVLEAVARGYPPGAGDAPFLANHDQLRLANQLANDPARLRLAASLLLSLPGAPFLWQGEELGMRQTELKDDEFKRTPLPWSGAPGAGFTTAARPWFELAPGWETTNVAAEAADPGSLLARYQRLIRARRASPALRLGDLTMLATRPAALAYARRGGGETVIVAHNLGDTVVEMALLSLTGSTAEPIFADPGALMVSTGAGAGPGWHVRLPPRSSAFWRMR
jgi:glycosidase